MPTYQNFRRSHVQYMGVGGGNKQQCKEDNLWLAENRVNNLASSHKSALLVEMKLSGGHKTETGIIKAFL